MPETPKMPESYLKFLSSLQTQEKAISREIQHRFNDAYSLNLPIARDIAKLYLLTEPRSQYQFLPKKNQLLSAAFLYGVGIKTKALKDSGGNEVEAEKELQLFIEYFSKYICKNAQTTYNSILETGESDFRGAIQFSFDKFKKEIYKNANQQYAIDTNDKTDSEIRHLIDNMSLFTAEEEASRESERDRMRKDSSRFYGDEFTKLGEETRLKKAELVEKANQLKAKLPSLEKPIFTSVVSPPAVPRRNSPPSQQRGRIAYSDSAPATPPRKHTPPPQRPGVEQRSDNKLTVSPVPDKDELADVAARNKTVGKVAKKVVRDVVQAAVGKVVNIQQGVNDALKASQDILEKPPNISKEAEDLLDEKYGRHRFFRESIGSDEGIQKAGATEKDDMKEELNKYDVDVMSEFDKMMEEVEKAADNSSENGSDHTPKL